MTLKTLAIVAIVVNLDDCDCRPRYPALDGGYGQSEGGAEVKAWCNCHICGSVVTSTGGIMWPHVDPLRGEECSGSYSDCRAPAGLGADAGRP